LRKFRVIFSLATILIIFFIITGCSNKVAVVNGEAVTRAEFNRRFEKLKAVYELQGADFSSKVSRRLVPGLKKQILDDIIREKVLLQEARKRGITVDETRVDKELARLEGSFASPEDFRRSVQSQKIKVDDVRDYLRTQMIIGALQEKVLSASRVTEEDARREFQARPQKYQQVEVSSILLADETEAIKVIQALARGEDFGQLAVEKSTEPGAAQTRGYLGWIFRGQAVPQVEEVAFNLKEGQFSPRPIRTPAGYAVILVKDKKNTFAELAEDIIHALNEQRKQDRFAEFTAEVMKKAKIEKKVF